MERIRSADLEAMVMTPEVTTILRTDTFSVQLDDDEANARLIISDSKGNEWIRFSLRTRANDGPNWQPTRLTDWKYEGHTDAFKKGAAVEHSKYIPDPRAPLTNVFSQEDAAFITNPFEALNTAPPTKDHLLEWLDRWKRVISSDKNVYPGYTALKTVEGLAQHTFNGTVALLRDRGFDFLTTIPTWFHVAQINNRKGFVFSDPNDAAKIKMISDRIPQNTAKERADASWIVMLQYWNELAEQQGINPEDHLARCHVLRNAQGNILTYPLRPDRNVWQEFEIPKTA